MKKVYPFLCLLLFGALIWTVSDLIQMRNKAGGQTDIASKLSGDSNCTDIGLRLGEDHRVTGVVHEGMLPALQTLDASGDPIDIVAAMPPRVAEVHTQASGIGGLRREELMVEANRLISALLRDGLLSEPTSYACAFANTVPVTGKANIIIERFHRMHEKHLALVERALTFGDRDSLTIRGWSQIRYDLAKMKEMATGLRNETALAAPELTFHQVATAKGFQHPYSLEGNDVQTVKCWP